MYGLLGDFEGNVIADGLSKELVYVRVSVRKTGCLSKTEVIIVRNKSVANVYGLPVKIRDGEVISAWKYEVV